MWFADPEELSKTLKSQNGKENNSQVVTLNLNLLPRLCKLNYKIVTIWAVKNNHTWNLRNFLWKIGHKFCKAGSWCPARKSAAESRPAIPSTLAPSASVKISKANIMNKYFN